MASHLASLSLALKVSFFGTRKWPIYRGLISSLGTMYLGWKFILFFCLRPHGLQIHVVDFFNLTLYFSV